MFGDLTRPERFVALVLSIALAFLGLVLAVNSRDGLLDVHGWIIIAVGLIAAFAAAGALAEQAPSTARLAELQRSYYDTPTKKP